MRPLNYKVQTVVMYSFIPFKLKAFTLVEMLMALLIISVILTASLPVITTRQKALASVYNKNQSFPVGGIIAWYHSQIPDNTWLECNGQKIPNGIEYETARQIFGDNMPDFQGIFLRGYGSQSFIQNNGSLIGTTVTIHASGPIGAIQGDALREINGKTGNFKAINGTVSSGALYCASGTGGSNDGNGYGCSQVGFAASRVTPVANEIRPINIAVKYIAKVRY